LNNPGTDGRCGIFHPGTEVHSHAANKLPFLISTYGMVCTAHAYTRKEKKIRKLQQWYFFNSSPWNQMNR